MVNAPCKLFRLIRSVTLAVNVMFVNGALSLLTISRKIRLRTVDHIATYTTASLLISLKEVINLYVRGGYTVNLILMDQVFVKLEGELGIVEINTDAAREHAWEIKRSNRATKEQCRKLQRSS